MIRLTKRYLSIRCSLHESPVRNNECAEFEIDKWVLSKFIIKRLVPIVGIHPFPLDELLLLAAAVTKIQPTHIFEWGTNIGKSARIFFETIKSFNINTEIHSIDLPDDVSHVEHPGAKRGILVRGLKGVTLHTGDGLDTSLNLCKMVSGTKFTPLFFVDGDHSYNSVKRDLQGIITHVPNAHILVHDTFNQSEESGYNTGPYQAVCDTLSLMSGKYQIIAQGTGLPGLTLVWHRPDSVP
ncbi:MAG: class I SAM-dependent methyltransferase [Proteobacteria bacterium]|nr:class I SAM-dependent methyltransferase [Pseudomonadota bacterium]